MGYFSNICNGESWSTSTQILTSDLKSWLLDEYIGVMSMTPALNFECKPNLAMNHYKIKSRKQFFIAFITSPELFKLMAQ